MELKELRIKMKSGFSDSKASAAFFDAIFEDPEAQVNLGMINLTIINTTYNLGIVWCNENKINISNYFF